MVIVTAMMGYFFGLLSLTGLKKNCLDTQPRCLNSFVYPIGKQWVLSGEGYVHRCTVVDWLEITGLCNECHNCLTPDFTFIFAISNIMQYLWNIFEIKATLNTSTKYSINCSIADNFNKTCIYIYTYMLCLLYLIFDTIRVDVSTHVPKQR